MSTTASDKSILKKDNDHLDTFQKMAEAAEFYLNQAFNHIDQVFEYELASVFFSEFIEKIDTTDEDWKLANRLFTPLKTKDFLRSGMSNPMTNETLNKIHTAWDSAQLNAAKTGHFFKASTEVSNISLLGHVNNLGFFIETLVNRHILFLNMTGELNDFSNNTIERSQLLNRLIYIFKSEIEKNILQLDRTSKLLKLRNAAVHYTPENSKKFKISLEELLGIWEELSKILIQMNSKEQFFETPFFKLLSDYRAGFKSRWHNKDA